jgi:hypothetical protein
MSEKLLSEYQCVLRELEMIKNRAAVIKDVTQDRLKSAKNEEEKENIFLDFKTQLHKIKKDKNIKHKYKNLIKRKEDIETEMLEKMSEDKPRKNIPAVKNSRQKIIKKTEVCKSSESSSDNNDFNIDLNSLINKYKKTTFPEKKHKKPTKKTHKKVTHVYNSNSENSSEHNTNIIVNVPNNCNNNCNLNDYGNSNNNNKKNIYVDSESCSTDSEQNEKNKSRYCLDDTQQVKKLYNLIKELQGEIDK